MVVSSEIELGLKVTIKIEECMDSACPHVRALDLDVGGRDPVNRGKVKQRNMFSSAAGGRESTLVTCFTVPVGAAAFVLMSWTMQ